MHLNKLLALLLPEGVVGPLTSTFNRCRTESDFSNQYSQLISLILTDPVTENDQEAQVQEDEKTKNLSPIASSERHPKESPFVEIEDPLKVREAAIYFLGNICALQESTETRGQLVEKMLEKVRPFFAYLPKAKTAKIVRNFIDVIADIPNTLEIQEQLCLETIHWCVEEKRMFLRHRVEVRLATLYHQMGRYSQALELIERLLVEVKRLDDKLLLVEIHYIECKLYFFTNNLSKAKAALTAARSNANAIHCPPLLHADLDIMSGAIHCEEGDPKTAFSYFYEAFEAFNIANDPKALSILKYMMLAKLMSHRPQDVISMSTQRLYLKYAGRHITAFQNIATSALNRNLELFKKTLEEYSDVLCEDPIIARHTHQLYEALLKDNILKVVKPYSRIEITHVARLMKIPVDQIQNKLNKMTLDHQLHATLDQGQGIVTIFDEPVLPSFYSDTLAVFDNLSSAVDLLHQKAQSVI